LTAKQPNSCNLGVPAGITFDQTKKYLTKTTNYGTMSENKNSIKYIGG